MTTLDRLQQASDSEFHLLCDDLLRRVEPRYRRLRTHGINPQGVSIKGQPDSYVGETANTCNIAFCYTVQKAGWWNKVVEDVKEAVVASPRVQEIVAAIPHNADRDGPKEKSIDSLGAARVAAGQATLRLVDGREIAGYLDRDHQDLRFEHLRIPYSRLSGQGILASCRQANEEAIAELVASGRYDPARYAPREADRELFGLWQRAFRPDTTAGSSGRGPTRLIPLVNDAGVGKTSLLATFARSVGSILAAILLQARNLSFASEDSLVAHVIHVLQGVLQPEARLEEEAAITHHLAAGTPLTIVLDGLDEAKDAASVRRAITYWLKSRLGQTSVLIVSSRPEFWKVCVDRGWTRWMHREALDDRTSTTTAWRSSVERTDPADGIRLPDRFSEAELQAAWLRAGQSRESLFGLSAEAREEVRHPFTLRVYLDLWSSGNVLPGRTTRAELLGAWLNRRLDEEAVAGERLTRQQYQQALRVMANRLAEVGAGSLRVDDLAGVPRFDPARPPGPVVERLVAANVLESVPGHPDHIRFAVEAVQDFYRAEAEVEAIVAAPTQVAERFAQLRLTEAYPRLARLGQLLVNEEARHEFVGHLANDDARMAAVVLRTDPARYAPEVRRKVADELGRQIGSRHRVRGAFAISLLSDLKCQEGGDCLVAHLLPPTEPHPYLKSVGGMAFARLGLAAGVGLTYRWPRFGLRQGGVSDYFKDTLGLLRGAGADFTEALTRHAWEHMGADSGTNEHGRAVVVLSHLRDGRLVDHLNARLTQNGTLHIYENHALVALGTDSAGAAFYRSASATVQRMKELGENSEERSRLEWLICYPSGDYPFLVTPEFGSHVGRLIEDDDQKLAGVGYTLAIRSGRPELIPLAIRAKARWKWLTFSDGDVRKVVTSETWLAWWNSTTDVPVRRYVIGFLPLIPNAEVEHVLIECLDDAELRGQAVWHLGQFGSYRSVPYLRQLLEDETGGIDLQQKGAVARSLGVLRDAASVPRLLSLASQAPGSESWLYAIHSLGLIASVDAEAALVSLLNAGNDDKHLAGTLILCGTPTAVERAIREAEPKPDGAKWLSEAIRLTFFWDERYQVGKYYTHIETSALVKYLEANEHHFNGDKWNLVDTLERIDSEEVRALLRRWASREGAANDAVVRENDQLRMSFLCYDELMKRGDVFAVRYFLDHRTDEEDGIFVALASENLGHFPRAAVATELRNRLGSASTHSQAVRFLALLGRFGDSSDEGLIRPFLDHTYDLVANVACESLLRLTDPLLVPEKWREL